MLAVCIVIKKQKNSLETQTKPAILWAFVENQVILEPILLNFASKCKQQQGSMTVYGLTFKPFCEIIINFILFSDKKWACHDQTEP